METYEQKVERVAKVLWVSFGGNGDGWEKYRNGADKALPYITAARNMLEEEARDIDEPIEPKRKPKRKLTLPMFKGQRVMCHDGQVREVNTMRGKTCGTKEDGSIWWTDYGRRLRGAGTEYPEDALYDAEEEAS